MISADTVVVRDSEPIDTTVDDEVVMLSVRAGAYFGLNGVGSEIWNMLREPRRVGDLCAALASTYDADERTLAADVTRFLQALVARGLARIVEDTGPGS
jgi:hypothetical protein